MPRRNRKKIVLKKRTLVAGCLTVETVKLKDMLSQSRPGPQEEFPSTSQIREPLVLQQAEPTCLDPPADVGSSTYHQRKEKTFEEWRDLQPHLQRSFVEGHALPPDAKCDFCEEEVASVTCKDCGPYAHFCVGCSSNFHRSLLHRPMIWKKGLLYPDEEMRCFRRDHSCPTTYLKILEVFDAKGRLHRVLFQLCRCEPEAAGILRYHLWPTQPKPKRAVSMELMKLIYFLRMEAHVSLKAASQVIGLQNNLTEKEVNALYSELTQQSFAQFQTFSANVYMQAVPQSKGEDFPACPKEPIP
nr:uncharacterized protein LOC129281391 [Lytechinus pictus]